MGDLFCFRFSPTMEGKAGTHARNPCPRQDSLRLHASDPRPIVYTAEELEGARTHDDLWNAAQLQVPAVPDVPLSLSSFPHLSPRPPPLRR